jgi:hypothetical protein
MVCGAAEASVERADGNASFKFEGLEFQAARVRASPRWAIVEPAIT